LNKNGSRKKQDRLLFDGQFLARQQALGEIARRSQQSSVFRNRSSGANPAADGLIVTHPSVTAVAVVDLPKLITVTGTPSVLGTPTFRGRVTDSLTRSVPNDSQGVPGNG
jgi:hypothetical protein